MSYVKIISQKLTKKKDTSRIHIESGKLENAGLKAGTPISVKVSKHKVTIAVSEVGERIISQRKERPVIDICNKEITDAFEGIEHIVVKITKNTITVEPLKDELELQRAKAKTKRKKIRYMEIFAGGGTLSKAFLDNGDNSGIEYVPTCAIELEEKYLENYEMNFPEAMTYCGSVAHVDIKDLPDCDIIVAGIPCEGYSFLGKTGRKNNSELKEREAHPTGHLGFFVLQIIQAIRPAVCCIEETVGFKSSAMATLTYSVLKSLGYSIHETILDASDYGSISARKRYCMVATIGESNFEFPKPQPTLFQENIEDILEIPSNERVWLTEENSSTIVSMKKQERKHQERGNGFRMAGVLSSDTKCGTITKGYTKRRLNDPVLTNGEGGYSFFSPRELARINGLPDSFSLVDVIGTSSEIVGQGVCYHPFAAVASSIKSGVFG